MDQPPGSATGICASCAQERPGQTYRFYFGWKLGQSEHAEKQVTHARTNYRLGGEGSFFLCKPCVRRINRLANTGTILALVLAGLFLTGFGLYTAIPLALNGNTTWWQPTVCAVCPGVLLFLAAIPAVRAMLQVGKSEGEKAAIRLARRRKLYPPHTVYWTVREFEKLRGE